MTAHEVAHQWWTIVVGNGQINEPWLDAALTQYSTMLYYEKAYGKQRADGIVYGVFVSTYESLRRMGRDLPAGLPANAYPPDLCWDIVYDKGALYFHELRERVGDEAFFELLRTYYARHRYQIATADSFLGTVEEITGDPQLDLYETWITGAP
jgi:aminopeptidase N